MLILIGQLQKFWKQFWFREWQENKNLKNWIFFIKTKILNSNIIHAKNCFQGQLRRFLKIEHTIYKAEKVM